MSSPTEETTNNNDTANEGVENTENLTTQYTEFESQIQSHEYYDHSLSLTTNMFRVAVIVGVFVFLCLLFLPKPSAWSVILFFALGGGLFCFLRSHPKVRMMSLIHEARAYIHKEAAQSLDMANDEPQLQNRDWVNADGVYSPSSLSASKDKVLKNHPTVNETVEEGKKNPTKLEMHFTKLENNPGLWSVTGESLDGRFTILHGLLAECTGRVYWVEQHQSPLGQRTILVEGYINYDTFQFMGGTWKDNLGCAGVHANLFRGPSNDAVSV